MLGRLSAALVKRVAKVTRAEALTPMALSKLDACDNNVLDFTIFLGLNYYTYMEIVS